MRQGTYDEQANALRFERRYEHPIEAVWRAVSEPEGLRQWCPAAVELELRPGAPMRFEFKGHEDEAMSGEVVEVDAPRLLEFLWDEDRMRIELQPDGDATLLRFTHFLEDRDAAARDMAGWHVCLEQLRRRLDGEPAAAPTSEPTDEHRVLYEKYVERGVPHGAPMPGGD